MARSASETSLRHRSSQPTCFSTGCVRELLLTITILQQLDRASSNRGSRLATAQRSNRLHRILLE
jgi:hypothetical protein